MRAHWSSTLPAGNSLGRAPGMTTEFAGPLPRCSTGSAPVTSMIGVDAVMVVFAPSTAPCSTRTPPTRMQRLPMNAPSSTITGRADGGSSTPPIPTPPERCTSRPICAQEPTVAQVSTRVPDPTRAPILTYPGMTETMLRRDLVVELQGTGMPCLQPGHAEVEKNRPLDPLVNHPFAFDLLGDSKLTPVQACNGLDDRGPRLREAGQVVVS